MTRRFEQLEPLEQWPVRVNGCLVEPGHGIVRIRPRQAPAIDLPAADVEELAAAATASDREVLLAAADEAERQRRTLTRILDGKATTSWTL